MINTSESVWIVDYCRSAFSKAHPFKSEVDAYSDLPAVEILAQLINAMLNKAPYPSTKVDELILGCALPVKDQWSFGARYPVMLSDLPYSCAAKQIEQQCASGLAGIAEGAQSILHGGADVVFCGGYENMSRIPMGPSLFEEGTLTTPNENLLHKYHPETNLQTALHMGLTAEKLANKYRISREMMDQFAYDSHQKAFNAQQKGVFTEEISPIFNQQGDLLLDQDVNIRAETSLEKLHELKPAFTETGSVSAGNSSPLTSGAALVSLMSDQMIQDLGIESKCKVITATSVGVDPELMGYGIIPAIEKLLDIAQLDSAAIDLWELNEAFSVVPLAAIQSLGLNQDKVNIHGGAIAIGHPLGASGVRLVGQIANALVQHNLKYGVVALCVGGGQGVAMLIENTKA